VAGAIGYFSSGWPAAYLVATVIFGIGLLIGFLCLRPAPADCRQSLPLNKTAAASNVEPVGRITGMVDCRWAGSGRENLQSPIPNPQSLVSLGDKFLLASA